MGVRAAECSGMLGSQVQGIRLGSYIRKYGQLVWGLDDFGLFYFNS